MFGGPDGVPNVKFENSGTNTVLMGTAKDMADRLNALQQDWQTHLSRGKDKTAETKQVKKCRRSKLRFERIALQGKEKGSKVTQ